MNSHILKRNYINVSGKGPKTVVFAHGFGCDQLVWRDIAPAFEEDYQVVLFDYVGSGRSDKSQYSPERYSSLKGYAHDVLEVCDALELKNIVLVGHSVSSMVGVLASIERPELMEKLIMIGPSPRYLNEPGYQGGFEKSDIEALLDMMEKNYNEWAKYLAPVAMGNDAGPELTADFERQLCSNDPLIARQFAEVTFTSDIRSELTKVSTPTLILQTLDDAIAPVEIGEYVHSKIPESEFVLMQATGHNPHINEPEETISYIKAFLSK
ncbi:MAG: alpha/beta hydrolase [Paenisporosarcina sp.]